MQKVLIPILTDCFVEVQVHQPQMWQMEFRQHHNNKTLQQHQTNWLIQSKHKCQTHPNRTSKHNKNQTKTNKFNKGRVRKKRSNNQKNNRKNNKKNNKKNSNRRKKNNLNNNNNNRSNKTKILFHRHSQTFNWVTYSAESCQFL